MTTRRVSISIDRLVLTGIAPNDAPALAHGLEQELMRLFADHEAVQRLGTTAAGGPLRVAGVTLAAGATPRRIGERVARGIAREMSK